MKKELENTEDIRILVHSFYDKVRLNEMLGPIFDRVIEDRWPEHLDKMVRFWSTVLLDAKTYIGTPFMPHLNLPVEAEHFDQWLALFFQTLDEHFEGEKAGEAKWRANKMAVMFHNKLEYYRNSTSKPLM